MVAKNTLSSCILQKLKVIINNYISQKPLFGVLKVCLDEFLYCRRNCGWMVHRNSVCKRKNFF